mmetsp:Transcript_26173/g.42895  ORF Transcript_26173/g.42895 Transcript_26173/m.42895 type:complete len:930 (-) Transcript_26173:102-2891(-)|eukprot:CAMPEP_0184668560 /NCGR_PEP_ID=MMETSP0308-20130426/72918_1 /TAXON_ID=38269 /ORGANISM="Gloeochaete witrockiana, Strain SAG 46.84" /LENGTH=929 /DNA_ID=CAMNT_0027114355 /DNA_START=83 /DNA_END=2872 /DNA_ORIENTATION=+
MEYRRGNASSSAPLSGVALDLYTRLASSVSDATERKDEGTGFLRLKQVMTSQNIYATSILLCLLGCIMACLAFAVDLCISKLHEVQKSLVEDMNFFAGYIVWILFCCLFAVLAAACPRFISPFGQGSGIPEMKSILSGLPLDNFLTFRTLVSKVLGLICALAAGLFVGKEGPFVTVAACLAHLLCSLPGFRHRFLKSQIAYSQVLSAGCAVGITAAFGTPVGAVLFSIEVTATYYLVRNLWWGFFAATCATIVFATLKTTGLVDLFVYTEFDIAELRFEIIAFALLGVLCGACSALFVSLSSCVFRWRHDARVAEEAAVASAAPHTSTTNGGGWLWGWRRSLEHWKHAYGDTVAVAAVTALFAFPFDDFIRNEYQLNMSELFSKDRLPSWAHLPLAKTEYTANLYFVLLVFVLFRFLLTAFANSLPIPCGVFVPVFTAGAGIGRLYGELMETLFPDFILQVPGVYAVAGAAALCAGVTHSISVAVVVLEITGQVHHILHVMTAVLLSYAVANTMGLSFYDELLRIQGLPYMPHLLLSRSFQRVAGDIMDPPTAFVTPMSTAKDARDTMIQHPAISTFALVESAEKKALIGGVSRDNLLYFVHWASASASSLALPSNDLNDFRNLFARLEQHQQSPGGRVYAKRARNQSRRQSTSFSPLSPLSLSLPPPFLHQLPPRSSSSAPALPPAPLPLFELESAEAQASSSDPFSLDTDLSPPPPSSSNHNTPHPHHPSLTPPLLALPPSSSSSSSRAPSPTTANRGPSPRHSPPLPLGLTPTPLQSRLEPPRALTPLHLDLGPTAGALDPFGMTPVDPSGPASKSNPNPGPSFSGDISPPPAESVLLSASINLGERGKVPLCRWPALVVDPAPVQVVESAPVRRVHLYFTMLACKEALVTCKGILVGCITKKSILESHGHSQYHRSTPTPTSYGL